MIDALRGSADELIMDEQVEIAESPEQAMLFADDWRITRPVERKTTHRIRTFRKAQSFGHSRQTTLFDDHLKSAKTA